MALMNLEQIRKATNIRDEIASERFKLEAERNDLLQLFDQMSINELNNPAKEIEKQLTELINNAIKDNTVSPDDSNDIKSFIISKITNAIDIIEEQTNTFAILNSQVNCFTNKCIVSWLVIFTAGIIMLLCIRNCIQYIFKITKYTEEQVVVVDGSYSAQNVCTLTIKNSKDAYHTIPIVQYNKQACNQFIQSVLQKPIRIYYKNETTQFRANEDNEDLSQVNVTQEIVYPITQVTHTLLKKTIIMFIAIFGFYFIYKKNLSRNGNGVAT